MTTSWVVATAALASIATNVVADAVGVGALPLAPIDASWIGAITERAILLGGLWALFLWASSFLRREVNRVVDEGMAMRKEWTSARGTIDLYHAENKLQHGQIIERLARLEGVVSMIESKMKGDQT